MISGFETDKIKPAIFLHIQKTAGTSVVNLVSQHYDQNFISHGEYIEKMQYSLDSKPRTDSGAISAFRNIPFLSGHFGYDFAKNFMDERYSFTFLRNPIERVLSFYFFCRSQNPAEYYIYKLCQECLLEEFLEKGLEVPEIGALILNNQVWQLACGFGNAGNYGLSSYSPEKLLDLAVAHLDEFSHVGFTETFEEDRNKIFHDLGIPLPTKKFASNANPYRPTAVDLPPSTLDLLDRLTQLDQVLYRKAWAKQKQTSRNPLAGNEIPTSLPVT